jgi:anaerobic dimethyl sulfoxide reductase subunit B (iron-sulfur subunit)
MSRRYGFHVDLASCTGCKACQIACKDRNGLSAGVLWRRVVEVSGGGWRKSGDAWHQDIVTYFVSTSCNHCERPICIEVCPTRAISQRADGIVTIDGGKCIACRYCEWACPYGAPQLDEARGVMTKCNLCVDDVDDGQAPACVRACQMRVLDFGDIEQLRARHGDAIEIHPLPERSLTAPAATLTPHPDCARETTPPPRIGNREEI